MTFNTRGRPQSRPDPDMPAYPQQFAASGAAQRLRSHAESSAQAAAGLLKEIENAEAALASRLEEQDSRDANRRRIAGLAATREKRR